MVGAALARCGRLDAAGLAAVVASEGFAEPAVAAHPLVVRPAGEGLLTASVLERALAMTSSQQVVAELLAMGDPAVVVEAADECPSPALLQRVAELAAGDAVAGECGLDEQWVLLRVGAPSAVEDLVVTLAGSVGFAATSGQVLSWLAAATSYPHLLAGLVDAVRPELRAAVARFAALAAAGGSPLEVFVAELGAWVSSHGRKEADWTRVVGGWGLRWSYVVRCTGLEQVAAAALTTDDRLAVCAQVVRHPRLVGGPSYQVARAQLVEALGGGPLPDAVLVDRARPLVSRSLHDLVEWVAREHDSTHDVAFAWSVVQQLTYDAGDERSTPALAVLVAAELVCIDGPGGRVGRSALAWVQHPAQQTDVAPVVTGALHVLASLTDVGVGGVRVDNLTAVWGMLGSPSWIETRVGEFLARVPGVGDPVWAGTLVDLAGGFTGTFDDLLAVATAVAA